MTGRERAVILRALEALHDGSPEEAGAFLEAVLLTPSRRQYVCPRCGIRWEFPGQLQDHRLHVHGEMT
jgi:hypothetical protein